MKKPRSHEIDEEAKNFIRAFFSPSWIVEEIIPDYGLDFRVTIVEEGFVSEKFFFIQLKGTDNLKENKNYLIYDYDVLHLLHFREIIVPIIFVLYDTHNNTGYWINIQQYCKEVLNNQDPEWFKHKYKRIKIPKIQKLLNKDSIKTNIIASLKENTRDFTEKLEWFEGYEKEINNIGKIEELINKDEIKAIKKKLHLSVLYYKKDDFKKMHQQFLSIYQQHRNDENHLQTILSIISTTNIFSINDLNPYFKLCAEGIKISKDLENGNYYDIFKFYKNYLIYFLLIKEKLPLLIFHLQAIQNKINIHTYIRQISVFQNFELTKEISVVYKRLIESLNTLLKDGKIIEYLFLQLLLIQIVVYLNSVLSRFLEEDVVQKNLENSLPLIKRILNLTIKLGNTNILLQTYLIIGSYFELLDKNKGRYLYLKGLNLSKRDNNFHYIKKFEYNLDHIGEEPETINVDEIKNTSLSSNIDFIQQRFKDLKSIEDEEIQVAIKFGLEDLNPLNYLKFCEHLRIGYNPSELGIMIQLYSLGWKSMGCSKKNVKIEPGKLKNLFELFVKKYCENCTFRKPRNVDFDPPLKILEEMYNDLMKIK